MAPFAQANLIENASFEAVDADWAYGNVDWWAGWSAKDGSVSIDLSGSEAGCMSQRFATDVGSAYEVNFWLAGNPAIQSVKRLTVSAGDVTGLQFSFDNTGHIASDMGWVQESFLFNATDVTSTLTFSSLIAGWFGLTIDVVSVEKVMSPVRLPASLLLFIPGMAGLAAAGRRGGDGPASSI